MDSRKNNESYERRREEALVRRMGEALDRLAPRDASECPDPELIAAYHERALQPQEIAQWESHFAVCSRCRKVLAVLAAPADTPLAEKEVARLGELVAAAQAPLEPVTSAASSRTSKPSRDHRLDWRGRWLAPALGVAAVLAVWFAMRAPWRTTEHSSSETLVAQAPKSEPQQNAEIPALEQFSGAAPKKNPETGAISPKDRSATRAPFPNPAAEALTRNRAGEGKAIGALVPSAGIAKNTTESERREQGGLPGGAVGGLMSPPPQPALRTPTPLPRAQAQAARETPPATEAPGSAVQPGVVTGQAPAAETSARSAANAPARDKKALAQPGRADDKTAAHSPGNLPMNGRTFNDLALSETAREGAALIKTPSGSISWRVGKGGSIERSTDTGHMWIFQASPLQEEWLAGTAVSGTICWLVGRNGAIARTTDGERWERIAPPSLAASALGKLPDLIGVTARDDQTATITASDQRRYFTRDGGKTWQAQ